MTEQVSDDLGIVWENTIDGGVWGCKVTRIAPGRGKLQAWEVATGKLILDEEVNLIADAIFGPDVEDLSDWQHRVLAVIDAQGKP